MEGFKSLEHLGRLKRLEPLRWLHVCSIAQIRNYHGTKIVFVKRDRARKLAETALRIMENTSIESSIRSAATASVTRRRLDGTNCGDA